MQNTGNGGKFAILAAVITAIAGIFTAIISISGPLIDKKMAIEATQTKEAFMLSTTKVAGVDIQKGETPAPQSPAATLTLPAPTLAESAPEEFANPQPSSTPDAAMLRVGESWKVNGLSITLTDIEFPAGNEVHLHFTFTNPTDRVINVKLDHNRDVSLTDDKGNIYKWASAFEWEVSISPNTSRNDEIKRRGNVGQAGYFIVKLDIPGFGSAAWKE